jgi:DtxR family manganese transport transcriptional regulator
MRLHGVVAERPCAGHTISLAPRSPACYRGVGLSGDVAVTDHSTPAAFRRTRRDHRNETAEDYVEAIAELIAAEGACRVTDLAGRFGVSHVTVIRIVQRLEREGYVTTEPYQPLGLTSKGRRLAKRCRERHDIVYRFLRTIGLDDRIAAIDSEGIEHHLSPETLTRFREIAEAGEL